MDLFESLCWVAQQHLIVVSHCKQKVTLSGRQEQCMSKSRFVNKHRPPYQNHHFDFRGRSYHVSPHSGITPSNATSIGQPLDRLVDKSSHIPKSVVTLRSYWPLFQPRLPQLSSASQSGSSPHHCRMQYSAPASTSELGGIQGTIRQVLRRDCVVWQMFIICGNISQCIQSTAVAVTNGVVIPNINMK